MKLQFFERLAFKMLVKHPLAVHRHTPPRRVGFFDLPLELREEIFTYCLNISPATYIIYKHAAAHNWSFRRIHNASTPAVLLVSKAMHADATSFLNRTTTGPKLRVNPHFGTNLLSGWMFSEAWLYDKADETDCVFDLEPLLSGARKVAIGVNVCSDLAEQVRMLALLRWMVAVINAREEIPEAICAEFTLEQPSLRPCEKGSLWQVLDALRCQNVEVVCFWRRFSCQWDEERLDLLSGPRTSDRGDSKERREQDDMDVALARQGVIDSCRQRHGRAARDRPGQ